MSKTRLSSKGQVVIPKSVRDSLHWEAGDELTVEVNKDILTIRRVERERRLPTLEEVRSVGGCLKYGGPAKSINDMNRGVDEGFRREWRK